MNISARNLLDDKLVSQIVDLLGHHRLTPNMLMLEVTESAIMLDSYAARTILRQLHTMGIYIDIDDFGVGYTSLAQLKDLPISELKIDKSFVLAMQSDQANELIVRSVVDLGHNLGKAVIAEGVETADVFNAQGGYHWTWPRVFKSGRGTDGSYLPPPAHTWTPPGCQAFNL